MLAIPPRQQPYQPQQIQQQAHPLQVPAPTESKIRLFIASYDNNCCQSTHFDSDYPPEIILHVSQIDYYNSLTRLNAASLYPTVQLILFRIFFLCFVGGLIYTLIEFTHMKEAISIAFLVTCVSFLAFVLMLKYMRTTRNQRLLNAVQYENEIYAKRPLQTFWSIAHGDKSQPTLIIDFIQPSFASFIQNNTAVTNSYRATPQVYDVMQHQTTHNYPQYEHPAPYFTASSSTVMPQLNFTYMNVGSSVVFPGLLSPSAPELTPPAQSSPVSKLSLTRSSTDTTDNRREYSNSKKSSITPQSIDLSYVSISQSSSADLSEPFISNSSRSDMV